MKEASWGALAGMAVPVIAAVACSSPRMATPVAESHLKVAAIEIGRAVGEDKRVTVAADTFDPQDTVFTSVVTEGRAAKALVEARWTFEGRLIDRTTQSIAPDGTAVTEFHAYQPGGWTPGRYQVEILVDGRKVGRREFDVVPSRRT